jgi:integrase
MRAIAAAEEWVTSPTPDAARAASSAAEPASPLAVVVQTIDAAETWLRIAIALAALAGLRCGEVRALQARDVDLDARRLFVRRAFSANEVGVPKGRDERAVPVTPMLAAVLTQACAGKAPAALLVVDECGRPLNDQAVGAAWRRLQARLGIQPAWRFHQLRHFFGTTCLRGGGNVEAVRRLLGHRDLASTTPTCTPPSATSWRPSRPCRAIAGKRPIALVRNYLK